MFQQRGYPQFFLRDKYLIVLANVAGQPVHLVLSRELQVTVAQQREYVAVVEEGALSTGPYVLLQVEEYVYQSGHGSIGQRITHGDVDGIFSSGMA